MFNKSKKNDPETTLEDHDTKGSWTERVEVLDDGKTVLYREYPVRFYGLMLIGLLNIASSMSWLSVAPVPDIASSYFGNASLTIVNWFSNVFMLVYLVAGPLSSFVYEKWSIKFGLIIGAVLQTVGSWLRFFSWFVHDGTGRLALALIGQVICAFGQPFILNAATPYAALWFAPDGRSSATIVGGLTNAVGMAIASLVLPALVTDVDEMWTGFLLIACLTTGFTIPTLFIPKAPKTPPSPTADKHEEERIPFLRSLYLLAVNYNFLLILITFGVLCGLFTTVSSVMAQITRPYNISDDEAGYISAGLVVAGIVGAVVMGIFLDKTKRYMLVLRTFVPILGFMYLAFLFVVKEDNFGPIMAVAVVQGFFTFSLLPVALDLSVECSYPVSESISSPLLWLCSQVFGLVILVGMDALREGNDANPPQNMRRALIMAAGLSMPMMLCAFVYNSRNKRLESEAERRAIQQQ
ncbi:major facilitator superfamily domain-containing protein [Syncephalastrum racemosum]|uniref:Major facilitator superfamily domain-containing protein n=1 Tax=Syncephalastrum racemosum TaxID=13706 RepID=A0A1X2HV67_SYNRA|nr:major facilitator superfamily domain-containing protein [Syncephalastrum racemosum]